MVGKGMRRILTAIVCLLLPARLKPPLLRLLGHKITGSAKISFSFIFVDRLALGANARIGPGNFIKIRRLLLCESAKVGYGNIIHGPLGLACHSKGAIGNRNVVLRSRTAKLSSGAILWLGEGAKITSGHQLDLTRSIRFGAWSILAGKASQIWTHGYVHRREAPARCRVDGRVNIGANVYIGSASVLNPGITIADNAWVGALSSVASDLLEEGLWVSQKLRHIERLPEDRLRGLPIISGAGELECVCWKGPHKPDRA